MNGRRRAGSVRGPRRFTSDLGVLVLALLFGCAAPPSVEDRVPDALQGTPAELVRVVDGDTIDAVIDGASRRIRLAEIDAPETRQPYGAASSAALETFLAAGALRLEVNDTDRYGRLVATLYVAGQNVNHAMVRSGQAWAYTEYAMDVRVIELEDEARAEGRGLWALPEADRVAPWIWRRARRGGAAPVVTDPRCTKHTCSEMTDCVDARFHLETCGLVGLDRDGDGVPCEQLCAAIP